MPDGQGGYVPSTNSRVAPDGSFLPAQPNIQLANALSPGAASSPSMPTPSPSGGLAIGAPGVVAPVPPGAFSQAAPVGAISPSLPAWAAPAQPSAQDDEGAGATAASQVATPPVLNSEQAEISRARHALMARELQLRQSLSAATTPEAVKIYSGQLDRLYQEDQQFELRYLDTIKEGSRAITPQEASQYGVDPKDYQVTHGKLEQVPKDAENTRLATAADMPPGMDPSGYQVSEGKLEAIPPAKPSNTEIVHLGDGTFQTVDKQTGKLIGNPIGKPSSMEPTLTPQAIEELASRSIQGDNSALSSLGYGKIGAANRTAVANRVADLAQEQGVDATGIVRNIVGLSGEKAGARTMGQMGARINTFAEEAKQTGQMALSASDAMPRDAWVPIEKIIQMGESAANNPKLSELNAANNAFANTYAKAVNPSGVPTDEGRRAAFALLNVAKNREAYRATVQQLQREMDVVQNAIGQSRASQLYGGQATPSAPPPSAVPSPAITPTPAAPAGAPQPGFIKRGWRFKGGDPSQQGNWEKAQ